MLLACSTVHALAGDGEQVKQKAAAAEEAAAIVAALADDLEGAVRALRAEDVLDATEPGGDDDDDDRPDALVRAQQERRTALHVTQMLAAEEAGMYARNANTKALFKTMCAKAPRACPPLVCARATSFTPPIARPLARAPSRAAGAGLTPRVARLGRTKTLLYHNARPARPTACAGAALDATASRPSAPASAPHGTPHTQHAPRSH